MKVEIVREKRKTLSLRLLDDERAVLKVPLKTSQGEINKFLEEKKRWISKNATKLAERKQFAGQFDMLNFIYVDGKPVSRTKEIVIGFDKMSESAKKSAIKKYYLSHFYELEQMAKDLSERSGLTYDEIRPVSSKKVWGSYNSKRVMKLNWKLVVLPKHLVEYVICHELSHSKHFNHKPQFWLEVERLCPDYKGRRKEIESYGFLLTND